MKTLLSVLFALALVSITAWASVPYPPNCSVTPCDALRATLLLSGHGVQHHHRPAGCGHVDPSGGGCINGVTDACVFRAGGVVIRSFSNVKSPDWDGSSGNLPSSIGFMI